MLSLYLPMMLFGGIKTTQSLNNFKFTEVIFEFLNLVMNSPPWSLILCLYHLNFKIRIYYSALTVMLPPSFNNSSPFNFWKTTCDGCPSLLCQLSSMVLNYSIYSKHAHPSLDGTILDPSLTPVNCISIVRGGHSQRNHYYQKSQCTTGKWSTGDGIL